MNSYQAIGNLTRDPELKSIGSDAQVVNFGLAINGPKFKDKTTGELKTKPLFLDCEAWGKTAEIIDQYLQKGTKIGIEGELQMDTWEDKDGDKRSKIKVRVNKFHFVSKNEATPPAKATKGKKDQPSLVTVGSEADIPF